MSNNPWKSGSKFLLLFVVIFLFLGSLGYLFTCKPKEYKYKIEGYVKKVQLNGTSIKGIIQQWLIQILLNALRILCGISIPIKQKLLYINIKFIS